MLFVITVTFTVITLGAYVKLSLQGLGPDWPGCYGILLRSSDNTAEILSAEDDFKGWSVDIGKALEGNDT